MTQGDMFAVRFGHVVERDTHYPSHPGFKESTTSKQAADELCICGRCRKLQAKVLDILRQHDEGLTPDECAMLMGEDILSVRPRFTELKRLGLIKASGTRRLSSNHKQQNVMVIA